MKIDPKHPKLKWYQTKKTKPITTIPIRLFLGTSSFHVTGKVLLKTLEGSELLQTDDPNLVICRGFMDDFWIQSIYNVIKNYDPSGIDPENGWFIWTPKSDAVRYAAKITHEVASGISSKVWIEAKWGEETNNGKFIQHGEVGDMLMMMPGDESDVYICKKQIFDNTYI